MSYVKVYALRCNSESKKTRTYAHTKSTAKVTECNPRTWVSTVIHAVAFVCRDVDGGMLPLRGMRSLMLGRTFSRMPRLVSSRDVSRIAIHMPEYHAENMNTSGHYYLKSEISLIKANTQKVTCGQVLDRSSCPHELVKHELPSDLFLK
jgi:hypothetical protein